MPTPTHPRTPTVRLARWSATHPVRALLVWFAMLAAAVATMALVPIQQTEVEDARVGESGRAAAVLERSGLAEPPAETVLVTGRGDGLDAGAVADVARELSASITDLPGVADVGAPVWSADRDAAVVPIILSGTAADASAHVVAVLDATDAVAADHPRLDIVQSGTASIDAAVGTRVGEDLGRAEILTLPVTLVIMVLVFGALVAAGIPVLLGIGSVVTAMGLYAPLSYVFPDGGSVASVVLLIGMAVGVDYSLFYLKREREERARGRSTIDAVEIAAATAGRAVMVSGLAVMVSLAGLFLALDPTFDSMAAASIMVVAVAMLGSLTFLPAMLGALGPRVDRGRLPLVPRLARRLGGDGKLSGRLIRPVVARPLVAAVVAGAALAALAIPALGMRTHGESLESLPQDLPAVAAAQRLQQELPTERPRVDVVLRATAALDRPAAREALDEIAAAAKRDGVAVTNGDGVRFSEDGRVAVLAMDSVHAEDDPAADSTIDRLRDTLVPRAVGDLPVDALVGGSAAETYDNEHRTSTLPLVIAFVLVLTLAMIWWTFRSITLALLTTALNLLSVGASFGVLVLVFQHGLFEEPLGFNSTGFVLEWIPLFCFVILVGLSMDYHVFVLSRVREGISRGLPFDRAVEFGVRDTAGVVTSAAAVMISVFAVFATLSLLEMKQLGVGLSVAILIDATVVRLVLLPASLLLLKDHLSGFAAPPRPTPHDAPLAEAVS